MFKINFLGMNNRGKICQTLKVVDKAMGEGLMSKLEAAALAGDGE